MRKQYWPIGALNERVRTPSEKGLSHGRMTVGSDLLGIDDRIWSSPAI
jgi:hypothetical protein